MVTKYFEIRDRATCISALAIKLEAETLQEDFLKRRAGFSGDRPYILLHKLNDSVKCNYDPYEWGDRTMHVSHLFIEENFETLTSGEVIDVEFILKETTEKKVSESESSLYNFYENILK